MSPTDLVTPPFLVAAGLLVMSGATKLFRPDPAIRALEEAGLPSGRAGVRLLALVEVGVGLGCLAAPGRALAASLALMYGLFAAFLVRLMKAGASARSCGCIGSRDAPPSWVHVGLDVAAAASGLAAAVGGVPGVTTVVHGPMLGIPTVLGLGGAGYAAYACAMYLPRAWASYRPHGGHGDAEQAAGPQVFRLSGLRS